MPVEMNFGTTDHDFLIGCAKVRHLESLGCNATEAIGIVNIGAYEKTVLECQTHADHIFGYERFMDEA